MARRYKVRPHLDVCAICGDRINDRNGIGFTQPNPAFTWDPDRYTGPRVYRTCARHNNAPYPAAKHEPKGWS